MTIAYQTYSPDTCECVIEQQYDDEIEPREVKLAFFHNVCARHKHLVKPQSKKDFERKSKQVVDSLEDALVINRARNTKQYDEHPSTKSKRETIRNLKLSRDTEQHAIMLEAHADFERGNILKGLEEHEKHARLKVLNGLHTDSGNTFGCEDVYDTIMREQRAKNG